jgi:predicted RNA methylase
VHTFTSAVTLVSAGSQSVTATDTANATITGSATVTVNPAAANTLVVAGFPSVVTAGTAGTFAVTAKDPYGNTATGYAGTVHFTSSDGQATLPVNSTLTSGTGSFSATLKTAGTQSLTATDTVSSSITGSQAGITVNPAAASTLTVAGFASPMTAGTAGSFTVTAKDAYGNTATGYAGTVHFSSSDGQAVLPANSMLTNGTGSFSATLKTAGAQSLTATDSVTTSITGSQTGITVNPAAASTLIVAGFPSPATAGTAGTFTVTAKDPYGNTATGYAGTLHFTSSDSQATLPANSTLTNGTGSFSATLQTAGTQSITATDTVTASITGTQSGITVNKAILFAAHINFTNSTTDPDRYVGYTDDIGLAYGSRSGGLSFGWNQDNTANARDRNNASAPDERYDTLNHMQKPNNPNASWKIAVPNGSYSVHLVSGDPNNLDSVFKVNVNGVLTVNGTPTSSKHWIEGTVSITVTNGFITVTNATGSSNNKVAYIDITQTSAPGHLLSDKIGDEKPGGDLVRLPENFRFVAQVYLDLLHRPADQAGLANFAGLLDQGVSRAQVVFDIENSMEFRTDEVMGLYSQFLHRSADAAGLAGFVNFLANGGTVEQAAALIVGSPEYFQRRGGSTKDGFLNAVYQDGLNRAIDPAGQAGFAMALANGATTAQIAAAIFTSSEFLQDEVRGFYQNLLHRSADNAGLSSFVNALAKGLNDQQVIAAIVGSDEFFAHV